MKIVFAYCCCHTDTIDIPRTMPTPSDLGCCSSAHIRRTNLTLLAIPLGSNEVIPCALVVITAAFPSPLNTRL